MKVGICFGGYCPMHRGHLDTIMKAKKENDICYVVVCGYENEPRANELGIQLNKRYQLIKEFFKGDEIIHVLKVNDTELGIDESMSFDNWKIWISEVFHQIANSNLNVCCNVDLSFYIAEDRYVKDLHTLNNDRFFEKTILGISSGRINIHAIPKDIDISATKIRKNPLKYWNFIVKPFRKFLTKNILVIGTASEGKTTLVRDIAKYFDIPHIEEYGRTYLENHNMVDTDITCHDFTEFLFNQRAELLKAEESYENNKGVIISDTDNLITLMYCMAYAKDSNINFTEEEFQSLKLLVRDHLIKGVYWDKIFIIPPGNKFVDDGSRYMKQSSIEERMSNYKHLMELIKEICPEYMDKMIELIPGDYYHNFTVVKHYINSILN